MLTLSTPTHVTPFLRGNVMLTWWCHHCVPGRTSGCVLWCCRPRPPQPQSTPPPCQLCSTGCFDTGGLGTRGSTPASAGNAAPSCPTCRIRTRSPCQGSKDLVRYKQLLPEHSSRNLYTVLHSRDTNCRPLSQQNAPPIIPSCRTTSAIQSLPRSIWWNSGASSTKHSKHQSVFTLENQK